MRPTEIVLPPRICALLYEKFNEELEGLTQRAAGSADVAELRAVGSTLRWFCIASRQLCAGGIM